MQIKTTLSSKSELFPAQIVVGTADKTVTMSVCDSEENRRKLAWLVPGYILLAWFFCVLFQPLSIHSPALRSRYRTYDKNYEVRLFFFFSLILLSNYLYSVGNGMKVSLTVSIK